MIAAFLIRIDNKEAFAAEEALLLIFKTVRLLQATDRRFFIAAAYRRRQFKYLGLLGVAQTNYSFNTNEIEALLVLRKGIRATHSLGTKVA